MNQTTFTTAIQHFFQNPNATIAQNQFDEIDTDTDISNEITIENLQPVSDKLLDSIAVVIDRTETGSIALGDLIRLRNQFYQAKDNLVTLEQKEHQDVMDLKSTTKWHERSKFVRIFLDSDKGQQLDEEQAEADAVTSTKNYFFEELEDLESVINYHILNIGEQSSVEFKNLVAQWRTIGQLQKDGAETLKHIKSAYNYLPSRSSCWKCGTISNNDASTSRRHLSAANNQLSNQLNHLTPWYNQLTEQVDSTINQVRMTLRL